MTCIVGLVQDGKVNIGADSQGTDGRWNATQRKDPKVFTRDGIIFGFTSSYRMGQLLRYKLEIPRRFQDESIEEFMHTRFIEEVRTTFTEGGFGKTDSGEQSGGSFLVGVEGRLFHIESDFQVGESELPFDACGCGDAFALGALTVLDRLLGETAEHRVTEAIKVAALHSAGVGGAVTVLSAEAST